MQERQPCASCNQMNHTSRCPVLIASGYRPMLRDAPPYAQFLERLRAGRVRLEETILQNPGNLEYLRMLDIIQRTTTAVLRMSSMSVFRSTVPVQTLTLTLEETIQLVNTISANVNTSETIALQERLESERIRQRELEGIRRRMVESEEARILARNARAAATVARAQATTATVQEYSQETLNSMENAFRLEYSLFEERGRNLSALRDRISRYREGLTNQVIERTRAHIKRIKIVCKESDGEPTTVECPICYDECCETKCVQTNCKHAFCLDCMTSHLDSIKDKTILSGCPVCRTELTSLCVTNEETREEFEKTIIHF
jgi:hypothetical protein